jgi:protein-arginine deiminase
MKSIFDGEPSLALTANFAEIPFYNIDEKEPKPKVKIKFLSSGLSLASYQRRASGLEKVLEIFVGDEIEVDFEISYLLRSSEPSSSIRDKIIEFEINGRLDRGEFTFVSISLDADVDRDGKIDLADNRKTSWAWGPDGHGAVLLVNCDRDVAGSRFGWRDRLNDRRDGPLDLEDLTKLAVNIQGPPNLPPGYEIRLSLTEAAAAKIRIFSLEPGFKRQLVGPGEDKKVISYRVGSTLLGVEGLQYPDFGFSGLISVRLILTYGGVPVASDAVLLRVAPWIANSSLGVPKVVYVAVLADNESFRSELRVVVEKAGATLLEVAPGLHLGDRWLQDEIEIGYSQSPTQTFPVVLDGPRNRELDDFAERALLGPNFGWVGRGDEVPRRDSLNSFGNLDCTPPLPGYPLGRVIIGGPGLSDSPRHMSKVVTDFLWAQKIQDPLELFSSWLNVGHVDEFICFVPSSDSQYGFKLLLSSPRRAFFILDVLVERGHGAEKILVDRKGSDGVLIEATIEDTANNAEFRADNQTFQRNIDWNRAELKKAIGISEADIIDLPVLYKMGNVGADAWTGNVVNMVVLGKHLAMPKPFGPVVAGSCMFEREVKRLLEPHGLSCHFLDTWYTYHNQLGGAHCGTNVLREPLSSAWWDYTITNEAIS